MAIVVGIQDAHSARSGSKRSNPDSAFTPGPEFGEEEDDGDQGPRPSRGPETAPIQTRFLCSTSYTYGPSGVPRSYRAIADHSGVPRSTLHHRAHGRRSIEERAESQQYLNPFEEKAVVEFILQMAELGTPARI
jgi:hypothetical protein